jgi:hypothetical protein
VRATERKHQLYQKLPVGGPFVNQGAFGAQARRRIDKKPPDDFV